MYNAHFLIHCGDLNLLFGSVGWQVMSWGLGQQPPHLSIKVQVGHTV